MDLLIPFLAENDEELIIYDYILNTKNRDYHYLVKRPGVFRLEELDDSFCFIHFRFYKADIRRLRFLLNIPENIILKTRCRVAGEEALCILLKRLAYPNRFVIKDCNNLENVCQYLFGLPTDIQISCSSSLEVGA